MADGKERWEGEKVEGVVCRWEIRVVGKLAMRE